VPLEEVRKKFVLLWHLFKSEYVLFAFEDPLVQFDKVLSSELRLETYKEKGGVI